MLRALTATGAMTQTTPLHPEAGAVMPTGAKRVRVTYENLTNDGFAGISGVDAFAITGQTTFELMAYEAGTERNNEGRPDRPDGHGARPRGRRGATRCRPARRGGRARRVEVRPGQARRAPHDHADGADPLMRWPEPRSLPGWHHADLG